MLVLALSKVGKEYSYLPKTARQVSKTSAQKICDVANEYKFLFNNHSGYHWHIHEVDRYDIAYDYAQYQKFTIRKGIVTARAI